MKTEPVVFIVDDDEAIRESLSYLLENADFKVSCYDSAQTFLEQFNQEQPGCLLLDIRLPKMSGLELLKKLVAQDYSLPIIMLSGHGDITMAVRAIKDGAFDFLEKPFESSVLLERVQQAIARDLKLRQESKERQEVLERLAILTAREREVMVELIKGKPNKSVARELNISYKTVEIHRGRIMEKMKADGIVELVRMAMLCGLLSESMQKSKEDF
ncbi:response regulator FixJ [Thioflexithrix psekupsensis]|uniref:DNA-binding response regulator n=1 Tax=Thioflexithrix psekupsensis TaxID=1570016 RepID=A0A251X744_9GAMM|nr:response regulator FixJ [Thioflexithrix psekupsensis]OUD13150.1 DNA-binding response regulator [Thioflexithrix psekupsensis]